MDIQNQIAPTVGDIELTATLPHEMISSQNALIEWCEKKILLLSKEQKELDEAHEHALSLNWKSGTLKRLLNESYKKIQYYWKIKEALQNGFYIVPNFPIQLFAIRTDKKNVGSIWMTAWRSDHKQSSQQLEAGEGEYKNPFPIVIRKLGKDSEGKEQYYSRAQDWDNIEFPITMAKPIVMEATSRAMALKIFDQIGVMPATKKEDPVIIGQIKFKKGYTTKLVSFMIAWHLNTNVL